MSPGRWQPWQCCWKIGAMFLLHVTSLAWLISDVECSDVAGKREARPSATRPPRATNNPRARMVGSSPAGDLLSMPRAARKMRAPRTAHRASLHDREMPPMVVASRDGGADQATLGIDPIERERCRGHPPRVDRAPGEWSVGPGPQGQLEIPLHPELAGRPL